VSLPWGYVACDEDGAPAPRGPISRSPNTTAVGDALRKAGIAGSTIVGGHGTTAKQAEIEPALAGN